MMQGIVDHYILSPIANTMSLSLGGRARGRASDRSAEACDAIFLGEPHGRRAQGAEHWHVDGSVQLNWLRTRLRRLAIRRVNSATWGRPRYARRSNRLDCRRLQGRAREAHFVHIRSGVCPVIRARPLDPTNDLLLDTRSHVNDRRMRRPLFARPPAPSGHGGSCQNSCVAL